MVLRSRANQPSTNVATNQMNSRIAVMTRFLSPVLAMLGSELQGFPPPG